MQILHQPGGAGSVLSTLHLSLGLARAGWPIRFVCPPDSEVETLAAAGGLEVHSLRLHPTDRRRNAEEVRRLLLRHPVALVNSQSSRDRAALVWLGLTRRTPAPFVVTRRQMPRTLFPENWLTSRYAARVIAVGPAVGEALVRRGTPRHKLAVVPNGLIAERVDSLVSRAELETWRRTIGWEPARRTIGIVSRLKDQAVVLDALDRVRVPVRLVLAGLERSAPLEAAIARIPNRHAVVCLPFTADVRPLYDLLDIVLLPSRMEGCSQALLEAMALGKPVAASAAGGNLDVVRHGVDGYLVAPLDRAAWAAALERLLADPDLCERLGSAARTTARVRFALERTVERTGAVYCQVLHCPAPGPSSDRSRLSPSGGAA